MADSRKLADLIISIGLLDEQQVQQAQDYALTKSIPLDDAFLFLNQLDYTELGQALSELYGLPYFPILPKSPPDLAKELVPLTLTERHHIFPVDHHPQENALTLAISNPEDKKLKRAVKKIFPAPLKVSYAVACKSEIEEGIEIHYKGKTYCPAQELEIPEDFTILAPEQETKEEFKFEDRIRVEKRILLLEPDLTRSKALKTILRGEGYQDVTWISSPGEIQNVLKETPHDLLLVNGSTFKPRGSWQAALPAQPEMPPISFYQLSSLLLGQEYPYQQMSEALVSLVSFLIRKSFKNDDDRLQDVLTCVRYCKLLALRMNLPARQVDGAVLAAWLSGEGFERELIGQTTTPYNLEEIVLNGSGPDSSKRNETAILNLVTQFLEIKKNEPEVAKDINRVRRLLSEHSSFPENDMILETFLNIIKDEEFLRQVDGPAHRILMVDSDELTASGTLLRLGNEGYEVKIVPDAREAVKIITGQGVDLIISEIDLPGTNGLKFCRALRSHSSTTQIPFFFLTSEEGERLPAECLETGADDFLKKPVDLELLCLKIKRILAMKTPKESKKGVRGSLQEMNATDIIQSLAASDKDVEIILKRLGEEGHIYIEQGEIIHAIVDDLSGEDAFYKLVAWEKGQFQIIRCSDIPPRTIHDSAMSLLMEGARLADEAGEDDEGDRA